MTEYAVLASWTIFIRLFVLLVILKLGATILPSMSMRKPPLSVRVIGNIEFAFGVCLAGPSMVIVIVTPVKALGWSLMFVWIILLVLGLIWSTMAIQLLRGSNWARSACLLLALVRLPVLIGLPFSMEDLFLYCIRGIAMIGVPISLVTLYVLFRNDTAQSFFQTRRAEARTAVSHKRRQELEMPSPVKCHAIFQVNNVEWGLSADFHTDILRRIVVLLRTKGMQCSRPQPGAGCVSTAVRQGDAALRVSVFAVQKLQNSTPQAWVWCNNDIPYWKRLLKLVPHASLYSGKTLEELCGVVGEILESESRLQDIRWLTPSEHIEAVRG